MAAHLGLGAEVAVESLLRMDPAKEGRDLRFSCLEAAKGQRDGALLDGRVVSGHSAQMPPSTGATFDLYNVSSVPYKSVPYKRWTKSHCREKKTHLAKVSGDDIPVSVK